MSSASLFGVRPENDVFVPCNYVLAGPQLGTHVPEQHSAAPDAQQTNAEALVLCTPRTALYYGVFDPTIRPEKGVFVLCKLAVPFLPN